MKLLGSARVSRPRRFSDRRSPGSAQSEASGDLRSNLRAGSGDPRTAAATKGVPLALPVPRVVSTGRANGTRKTCYGIKLLRYFFAALGSIRKKCSLVPALLAALFCVSSKRSENPSGRSCVTSWRLSPFSVIRTSIAPSRSHVPSASVSIRVPVNQACRYRPSGRNSYQEPHQ